MNRPPLPVLSSAPFTVLTSVGMTGIRFTTDAGDVVDMYIGRGQSEVSALQVKGRDRYVYRTSDAAVYSVVKALITAFLTVIPPAPVQRSRARRTVTQTAARGRKTAGR